MTDHAQLSGTDLARLTAIITGGGYKRSANREAAEKRFVAAATEVGVRNATDLAKGPYDLAEHVIRETIAGKPLTIAEVAAMKGGAATEPSQELRQRNRKKITIEKPDTPVQDAVEAAFRDYIATDDRSDQWMKALFQRVFEEGSSAAKFTHSKRERKPRAEGPTKREIAANLLRRPEGCTSKDILEATGWTAVSVPSIAKAAGLALRQEKVGRSTQYYGVAL